jgi:uncharacterized membrane protein
MYLGLIGSLVGLVVSLYIYRQKKKKVKLICPRESNCEKVVHSTHATTLGMRNEILGILYYGAVGVLYMAVTYMPQLLTAPLVWILVTMTSVGVVFSIYLLALQGLVIRAWCMWCLGSTLATTLLAISLFHLPSTDFIALVVQQRLWWVIIHNVGFILGIGGATITDLFFFRFLKDGTVSEEEKGTMDTLSSIIWVGLAILAVSGLMLYLADIPRLSVSPKFLLKVVVVGVITINGFLLNLLVAPRMRMFSFQNIVPVQRFRRLAFALGGVSIVSWYVAFLLGSFRKIDLSFYGGLGVYVGLLTLVIIGSQIAEHTVARRRGLSPHSLPTVPKGE